MNIVKKLVVGVIFGFLGSSGSVLGASGTFGEHVDFFGAKSDLPGGTGIRSTLTGTITNAMIFLASVLAILAVIGFVISGILYVTSAGNEDRMETAKRGMMYSIIGVVVGAGGFILLKAVDSWLKGSTDI